MGRFQIAFESKMASERKVHARYGQPATEYHITAVETGLRLPIPTPLRSLYTEFDGLWFDELGRDVPPNADTEWYEILPLALLIPARDRLAMLYGKIARDRRIEEHGSVHESDDFDSQLARCVAFSLAEHGASFKFLTDENSWGIVPGRVGGWNHDGGVYEAGASLEKYLAVIGRLRSRGM
jgi:hypothetical protein